MITCILSSFNRPEGLRRSFESIRRQTIWDQLEVVICDDNSPNTEVQRLLSKYELLPNVRVLHGEVGEVMYKKIYCTFTDLINRALDTTIGEYVTYLTDGNEYTAHACERHKEHLDGMQDVFLVWGMVQNIKDQKRLQCPAFNRLPMSYIRAALPRNNFIDHSSVMHRRSEHRWSTDPQSWMYADWLFWRELLKYELTFVNHGHHVLDFYMDKDSFGRCLINKQMSFEETMRLKMKGADMETDKEGRKMKKGKKRMVEYAKNTSGKIQSDLHGNYIDPEQLVKLDDVMTPRGNLLPGFVPFGSVGEYTPKKRPPKKPPVPGQKRPAPPKPKVPFAGMESTVEAARKKAEQMAAERQEPKGEAVEVVTDDEKAKEQQEAARPARKKKPVKKAKAAPKKKKAKKKATKKKKRSR